MKANANSAKILILAVILSGIGITASEQWGGHPTPRESEVQKQNPWSGFFKPVDKNLFLKRAYETGTEQSLWLFRPSVELTALQLIPSKENGKVFDVSSFKSIGMGISYQHFTTINGLPYNNYGFNVFALFDAIPSETTAINISGAVTVSALQYLNLGGGYNIGLKKFFLLAGIQYNFN